MGTQFSAKASGLPEGCIEVPFGYLTALGEGMTSEAVAAFIVEPIQGKGVIMPPDEYLGGVRAVPEVCDTARRRRNPDRVLVARAGFLRASTGASSRTLCSWPNHFRAATFRWAPC